MQTRRNFVRVGIACLLDQACSKGGATVPTPVPNPPTPAPPNPLALPAGSQLIMALTSRIDGLVYQALDAEGLNPGSSPRSFTYPNGTKGSDIFIHSLLLNQRLERPAEGYIFIINGHYHLSSAYSFPIHKGDRIEIYKPPLQNRVA